jgi:AAA domain, putative AbiEii toxin, Type IV TA system
LQILTRRGEQVLAEPSSIIRSGQVELDIAHLFYGHEITAGTEFSISTRNQLPIRNINYRIALAKPDESPLFIQMSDEGPSGCRLALWTSGADYKVPPLPLSKSGSLRHDVLQQSLNLLEPKAEARTTQFVVAESFNANSIAQLWSSIVLTPEEDRVVRALQIIDKSIKRIAQVQTGPTIFVSTGFVLPSRGGFYVLQEGQQHRIPIGSFGDGIWRMAVAIVRAKDSLLLVDEIDTGLHYTVMEKMWSFIDEASDLFNVQVFATTHSYDCVHSLATICKEGGTSNKITIQRIEAGRPKSVPFSEEEILAIAERNIEVR